jgi:hypothetical protein
VILSVQSVTYSAGTNAATLDVALNNTGPGAVTIGGFSFGLSVATTNLTFTSVNISTFSPYIFAGNSLFGPDISVQPPNLPGQAIEAQDLFAIPGSGTTVSSGATFGLGRLVFNLSSLAPLGPIAVSFIPADDSLSDASGGANIPFTTTNGAVMVTASTSPEPATGAFVGAALLALIHRLRQRA